MNTQINSFNYQSEIPAHMICASKREPGERRIEQPCLLTASLEAGSDTSVFKPLMDRQQYNELLARTGLLH